MVAKEDQTSVGENCARFILMFTCMGSTSPSGVGALLGVDSVHKRGAWH